jgi:protein TonB
MSAIRYRPDENGALTWIAASLIAAFAHALVIVLLLRSATPRTLPPEATPATAIDVIDWPTRPAVASAPGRTFVSPLQPSRSHALKSSRTAVPRIRTEPHALIPPESAAAASALSSPAPRETPALIALPALPGRPVSIDTPSALSALQVWEAAMREQLARYKRYPDEARSQHQEDTVSLRISVARNGQVLRVSVVNSHGYRLLDQEALQMVQLAEPLPPLPAALDGDRLNIVVPIEFFLLQAAPLSDASVR